MDGRWWWMTNLFGLLALTAAVFTWLGWWLHVEWQKRRSAEQSVSGDDTAKDEPAAERPLRERAEVSVGVGSSEVLELQAAATQPFRERQELLPLAVSLSLSADELRRAEDERDGLRVELELLKQSLDAAVPFRSGQQRPDDLKKIRGVGEVLEARLNAFGVFTYAQIAGWSAEQVALFGKWMGFGDRVRREDWQGQCRELVRLAAADVE
jgi:predicted flap endonuclease-1-like 5' DNA nuclease